jgi:hypothetical protein
MSDSEYTNYLQFFETHFQHRVCVESRSNDYDEQICIHVGTVYTSSANKIKRSLLEKETNTLLATPI